MNIAALAITAVIALAIGILIGLLSLRKLRTEVAELTKNGLSILDQRNYYQKQDAAKAKRIVEFHKELTASHARSGCKNGDLWSDHTDEHPEGMTPKRAARIEADRKAKRARQDKENADRISKRSTVRTSRSGGGLRTSASSVFIADSTPSFSYDSGSTSCDAGSSSCD